jgi:hypothetical protein
LRAPNGSRNTRENDAEQHRWPILVIEERLGLGGIKQRQLLED